MSIEEFEQQEEMNNENENMEAVEAIIRMTDDVYEDRDEDHADINNQIELYQHDTRQYTDDQHNAMEEPAVLDSGADHSTIPESLAVRLPWDCTHYPMRRTVTLLYGNNTSLQALQEMTVGDYYIYVMPDTASQALISVPEIVDEHHVVTLRRERATIEHETGVYTLNFPREMLQQAHSTGHSRQWMVPISVLHQLTLLREYWEPTIQHIESQQRSEAQAEADHEATLRRMAEYRENQQQHEEYNESERAAGRIPGLNNVHTESKEEEQQWESKSNDDEDDDDVYNVSRALSARLHVTPKTDRERVINLHERMGHAPEDVMCMAVDGPNPEWINTGVDSEMIRRVFVKEP